MTSTPTELTRALRFAVLILIAAACDTRADDREEFWPEWNGYAVAGRAKMHLSARVEATPEDDYADGKLGVALDVRLMQRGFHLLRRAAESVAHDRASRLSGRIGYLYGWSLTDGRDVYEEDRVQADLTGRWDLPGQVLATDRNRAEFRWLRGDYSFRYRNRLRLERDVGLGGYEFAPYGMAEVFYDSRYDEFNRIEYTVGLHAPVTPHVAMDTYYMRRDDDHTSPKFTNVLGVVFDITL